MKFIKNLMLFLLCNLLITVASYSAGDFEEFRTALQNGETETAAVILHEILIADQFSSQLWKQAADICLELKKVTQALVFYKAALNLEKSTPLLNQLKNKIENIKTNCGSDFKIDYVVTFATISVKLLKSILSLPIPADIAPTASGIREIPGLAVKTEKELEKLENSSGSIKNSEEVSNIDTKKKNRTKKSKNRDEESTINNTIPVEKMPSYNQTELMKNIVYPEDAILNMKQGKVNVKVFINSEGKPIKPEIKSSTNKIFNKAAMDAVLKTNFESAKQNGQPIGCWMYINIYFVLKHDK
jgi:TonB family protein